MIVDGQPGHICQIKQTNAGAVYRLIDRLGPISRIELSKKAQLAPASITKIVHRMLETHLVQETDFHEPCSRGRPAIGLILDNQVWHYLSVSIGCGDILLALRDLGNQLIVEESCPLPINHDEPLLQRIVAEIDAFFTHHQNQLQQLSAIAITLPGILDSRSGIVHRMPFYDVIDMPLGPELEARTGLPVYIQHDVSAWTLAESLFGASQDAREVIQVVIDNQVGAGVITGGRLLHDGCSSLVEIGHTQVDPQGKPCYCGNRGCLETVVSSQSLLNRVKQRLQAGESSSLQGQILSIQTLCQSALQGDPLAFNLIAEVGENVGRIVAVMVNLFNPQKILIGSPLNQAQSILFPIIANAIRRQALPAYSQKVEVEPTFFKRPGTMRGAALVKDALYKGTLLVNLLKG